MLPFIIKNKRTIYKILTMETWSKKIDFTNIGRRFGTPLYIFNTLQLEKNFNDYLSFVEYPQNICYPIKANPSFAVLQEIANLNGGADCANLSEVRLAEYAGITSDKIIYNCPCPELTVAIDIINKGGKVVIDSTNFYQQLSQYFHKKIIKGHFFVRVNPTIIFDYQSKRAIHKLAAHSAQTSKFGIPETELLQILKTNHLPITGLHLHVGSRMDNIDSFKKCLKYLHQIANKIHKNTKHTIRYINIGGGLGVSFSPQDIYPTINALVSQLIPLKKLQFQYMVEPGNSLVGNTMGLLTKVEVLKKIRSKLWAIINVGSDQLINGVFLGPERQILNQQHKPLAMTGKDSVGGPLCFGGDVLLKATQLKHIQENDYLFIQHCGSYCYALSNHFNSRHYTGMIQINADQSINHCNIPEDEYLDANYATFYPNTQSASTSSRLLLDNKYHFLVRAEKINDSEFMFFNQFPKNNKDAAYTINLYRALLENIDSLLKNLNIKYEGQLDAHITKLVVAKNNYSYKKQVNCHLFISSPNLYNKTKSFFIKYNFLDVQHTGYLLLTFD